MLDLKGWTYSSAIVINGLAVVKPDFYPPRHVLAMGKRGYIYCDGHFKDWVFLEEKEWVITDGSRWLASFSNLSELPKRSKYRC